MWTIIIRNGSKCYGRGDAKSVEDGERMSWLSMGLSGVPDGSFTFLISVPNLVHDTACQ